MRSIVLIAAMAIPLLASGCADRTPDPRGVDHNETLLSLSATGEAESVPDIAFIEIGVEGYAPNAKDAGTANARKAEQIAAALAKFGVEEKDLQTRNLSIQRVDYGPRKGQFQASNVLSVRLRNTGKAGEAVAAATDAGANVLSGPALQISDPERANRGAYIAAYRAAKTRAEAYAEAAGMEISRVLAIRDGGGGSSSGSPYGNVAYEERAVDAAAPVAAPAPVIRTGTNRVTVSVQVDFALKPK